MLTHPLGSKDWEEIGLPFKNTSRAVLITLCEYLELFIAKHQNLCTYKFETLKRLSNFPTLQLQFATTKPPIFLILTFNTKFINFIPCLPKRECRNCQAICVGKKFWCGWSQITLTLKPKPTSNRVRTNDDLAFELLSLVEFHFCFLECESSLIS